MRLNQLNAIDSIHLFNSFIQADAILEMEQRHFCQASLEYVFRLQEVHERKKFEFVETVISVNRSA